MSDLSDKQIEVIWSRFCFESAGNELFLLAFGRAVIAASQEGRTALPANSPSSMPGPSRAFVPYDGLTAEFIDEVCRFAGDAEGLSQAISAALETCEACIVPAPPTALPSIQNYEGGRARVYGPDGQPLASTAPRPALEAQQEGAMPPALVERGIERRKHFEAHLGNCYRLAYTNMLVPDRRIKDRRRA